MMIPEDTGKEHRRSWRDKLRVSDSDMHDEEGTYTDHYLVVGERVVKSKFCFIAVKLMDFAILIITGKLSGNSVL